MSHCNFIVPSFYFYLILDLWFIDLWSATIDIATWRESSDTWMRFIFSGNFSVNVSGHTYSTSAQRYAAAIFNYNFDLRSRCACDLSCPVLSYFIIHSWFAVLLAFRKVRKYSLNYNLNQNICNCRSRLEIYHTIFKWFLFIRKINRSKISSKFLVRGCILILNKNGRLSTVLLMFLHTPIHPP